MEKFRKGIASCLDTEAIESLISIILQLPADPAGGRKGGFFSVYDSVSMSMVTKSFGDFSKEKAGQYFRNSTEKVTRLVKNPEHYHSFQSRDESKEWWGGGVHYGDLYCAFSGFPEKLDEALSLIYAMYVDHCKDWNRNKFKNAVLYQQRKRYEDNEFILMVLKGFLNDSIEKNTFLNSSFKDLDIDTRTINCLRTVNIKTPKELIACPYSDLLKIRNLGEISLRKLDGLLREHGFVLNEAWD